MPPFDFFCIFFFQSFGQDIHLFFILGDQPFADIAQLGERQTEDLKVPGSIPGVGIYSLW